MRAVIFGASGFIGSHVLEAFAGAGWDAVPVVRKTSDVSFARGLGLEPRAVDFGDESSISGVIAPGDVVCNGIALPGSADRRALEETEVELTARIVRAARDAGARAYLQLSSIIAYGNRLPPEGIDEAFPPRPDDLLGTVSLRRERTVEENCGPLPYVLLQPVSTIGARDRNSFSARMKSMYAQGRFPLVGGGKARLSLIDTRDIGRAFVHAAQNLDALADRKWLVGGFDASWVEIFDAFRRLAGEDHGALRLPLPAARGLALIGGLTGGKRFSPVMLRMLSRNRLYDDRAFRATGFRPEYGLEDALGRALAG